MIPTVKHCGKDKAIERVKDQKLSVLCGEGRFMNRENGRSEWTVHFPGHKHFPLAVAIKAQVSQCCHPVAWSGGQQHCHRTGKGFFYMRKI